MRVLCCELSRPCLSLTAAKQYASRLRKDLRKCYANNVEQQMWRHCFYGPVETLRGAGGEAAHALLLDLFNEAIRFYEEELIGEYEASFDIDFTRALLWPITGFPSENLTTCLPIAPNKRSPPVDDEVVHRSAQRLFLAVGDLYRYRGKLMRSGSDMDSARLWYLKAAQLSFSNGRCYNQAAIVVTTSRLDQAFFFMMAIAAKHPFPAAKESLDAIQLNEIRELVGAEEEAREKQLRHERDKEAKLKAKAERIRERRSRMTEIWIRPGESHITSNQTGGGSFNDRGEEGSDGDESKEGAVDTEKQILYILHVAGTLGVSRVGVDKLGPVSQRVISTLPELAASEGVTALAFVKITLITLFALHRCGEGSSSQAAANLQRDLALHITLALFEALLNLLVNSADTLGLFLMVGKLSKKIERVLPALCLLSAWAQQPTARELMRSANDGKVSAAIRRLSTLMSKAHRVLGEHSNASSNASSAVLLPELVLATVLHGVFPADPLPTPVKGDNLERGAIIARLSVIAEAGGVLQQLHDSSVIEEHNADQHVDFVENTCADNVDENETAGEEEDEERLKRRLIEEEHSSSRHEWAMEVRPHYLVPDTNAFVDHLQELKAILDSKQYTLLVPTIVLAELSSLSLGDFATRTAFSFLLPSGTGGNTQQKYVEANARETVQFLREESEKRNPHLLSVTSNGNILPRFSFACETSDYGDRKTNDDRILAACVALTERQPKSATKDQVGEQKTLIKRSVVFLTEDRALTVKTLAAKIPVKTVPAFIKWAGLAKRGKAKR